MSALGSIAPSSQLPAQPGQPGRSRWTFLDQGVNLRRGIPFCKLISIQPAPKRRELRTRPVALILRNRSTVLTHTLRPVRRLPKWFEQLAERPKRVWRGVINMLLSAQLPNRSSDLLSFGNVSGCRSARCLVTGSLMRRMRRQTTMSSETSWPNPGKILLENPQCTSSTAAFSCRFWHSASQP